MLAKVAQPTSADLKEDASALMLFLWWSNDANVSYGGPSPTRGR